MLHAPLAIVNPPADYDYWDRAIRCVYEDKTKWVWDSEGGSEKVSLDHDRPCWQSVAEEDCPVPEWADQFFDTDIGTVKTDASEAGSEMDVDAATEQRLEDLGYK